MALLPQPHFRIGLFSPYGVTFRARRQGQYKKYIVEIVLRLNIEITIILQPQGRILMAGNTPKKVYVLISNVLSLALDGWIALFVLHHALFFIAVHDERCAKVTIKASFLSNF